MSTTFGDHRPLTSDAEPLAMRSEAATANHADAAVAYLRRMGALDLAPMLGIGEVA